MKKLLILFTLVTNFSLFAQKEIRKTLYKNNKFEITQVVKNDTDTIVYMYWGYQNAKYQHITDIGSIFITSGSELIELANKLIEFGNIKTVINQRETINNVSLILYDFSKYIYIENKEGKYTMISKSEAIKIGTDMLSVAHYLK